MNWMEIAQEMILKIVIGVTIGVPIGLFLFWITLERKR